MLVSVFAAKPKVAKKRKASGKKSSGDEDYEVPATLSPSRSLLDPSSTLLTILSKQSFQIDYNTIIRMRQPRKSARQRRRRAPETRTMRCVMHLERWRFFAACYHLLSVVWSMLSAGRRLIEFLAFDNCIIRRVRARARAMRSSAWKLPRMPSG
jgi:hypothetical protein